MEVEWTDYLVDLIGDSGWEIETVCVCVCVSESMARREVAGIGMVVENPLVAEGGSV